MERETVLLHLDRQLDELHALASALGDDASRLRSARLRALLAAVAELRDDQPITIPEQRTS